MFLLTPCCVNRFPGNVNENSVAASTCDPLPFPLTTARDRDVCVVVGTLTRRNRSTNVENRLEMTQGKKKKSISTAGGTMKTRPPPPPPPLLQRETHLAIGPADGGAHLVRGREEAWGGGKREEEISFPAFRFLA